MKKSYDFKKYTKESIGQVRNGFSRYLDAAADSPVIITDRGVPKSVIIDYGAYLEIVDGSIGLGEHSKQRNKELKSFRDCIGIAKDAKQFKKNKKINISKEINDAWTQKYTW